MLLTMMIWAVVVLLLVIAGLVMLVGHALRTFGRSSRSWQQSFGELALWPALVVQIRHPVASVIIAWAAWTLLGCGVIGIVSLLI
jgi:hypothetical protein